MISKGTLVGSIVKHARASIKSRAPSSTRSFLSIADTVEEPLNPLSDLREMAHVKNLCDNQGYRVPDKHWTFVLSASDASNDKPPKIKTLNFQRVSDEGIDFVSRQHSKSMFSNDRPLSFLYTEGKYKPGNTIIQWRADGVCEKIRLEEILAHIPEYSITEMVAAGRARRENNSSLSERKSIGTAKSHYIEIVQKARMDLMSSNLSLQELNDSIQAWRFIPHTMEKMSGGPDEIMWNRLEFRKEKGSSIWGDSNQLMPY